jgi:hypothetical protein
MKGLKWQKYGLLSAESSQASKKKAVDSHEGKDDTGQWK